MRWPFPFGRRERSFEFRCVSCGQMHRGSPSFSLLKPDSVFAVPEDERARRVKLNEDLCVIGPRDEGEAEYWIRAILEVPIHGAADPFTWGVWVTQSRESFERYATTYAQDQTGNGSFGWLPVHMRYYRDADGSWPNLEADVYWQAKGQRPHVMLWECDHPLFLDQQNGISWEKAIEIATLEMH